MKNQSEENTRLIKKHDAEIVQEIIDAEDEKYLDNMFEQTPNICEPCGECASFFWSANKIGFGMINFCIKDNKIYCDNDHMSKEFILKLFGQMLEDVEIIENELEWDE